MYTSHHGLGWPGNVPFVLSSAFGELKLNIHVTLSLVKWQIAFQYNDDIMIFSRDTKEYISHVITVLTFFEKDDIMVTLVISNPSRINCDILCT